MAILSACFILWPTQIISARNCLTVSEGAGHPSGEVVPVLDDWSLPPMDLWVIYPSGRLTGTKVRAFGKWFETIIGEATAKV